MKKITSLSFLALTLQTAVIYADTGASFDKPGLQNISLLADKTSAPRQQKVKQMPGMTKEIDKTIVEISVGRTVFAIPKHYVSPMSKKDFLDIELMLPRMISLNEFMSLQSGDVKDTGQSVIVLVRKGSRGGDDVVLNNQMAQGLVVPGQRYPEWQLEEFVPPSKKHLMYYRSLDKNMKTPSGKPFVIVCDVPSGILDAMNGCEVSYAVLPDVSIRYYYRFSQLRHWKKIDDAVRNLVTSFAKDGK